MHSVQRRSVYDPFNTRTLETLNCMMKSIDTRKIHTIKTSAVYVGLEYVGHRQLPSGHRLTSDEAGWRLVIAYYCLGKR